MSQVCLNLFGQEGPAGLGRSQLGMDEKDHICKEKLTLTLSMEAPVWLSQPYSSTPYPEILPTPSLTLSAFRCPNLDPSFWRGLLFTLTRDRVWGSSKVLLLFYT